MSVSLLSSSSLAAAAANLENQNPEKLEAFAFTEALKAAKEEKTLADKKVKYQAIFEQVRDLKSVNNYAIALEQYAGEILYNQTIDGNDAKGFALSARLMEFTLLVQLKALGLIDKNFLISEDSPIFQERNLEALVASLEKEESLDAFLKPTAFNLESAENNALAKTLIRLSFSYQNSLKHNVDKELQERIQALTESQLGDNIVDRVEYLYNRLQFMLVLRNPSASLSDKIQAYQVVLNTLQNLDDADRFRLGKEAQVLNIQAITYIRGGGTLAQAKPLSRQAVQRRESLYNTAASNSDKAEQSYFLANALSVLLHCIKEMGPTEEEKVEVKRYLDILKNHLAEMDANGDNNTYRPAYVSGITKAEAILTSDL